MPSAFAVRVTAITVAMSENSMRVAKVKPNAPGNTPVIQKSTAAPGGYSSGKSR